MRLRRILVVLATMLLAVCMLSLTVTADTFWDGSGDASGGGGVVVTGEYKLPYDDVNAVLGYRFSVYDEDGAKVGKSLDLYFKSATKS